MASRAFQKDSGCSRRPCTAWAAHQTSAGCCTGLADTRDTQGRGASPAEDIDTITSLVVGSAKSHSITHLRPRRSHSIPDGRSGASGTENARCSANCPDPSETVSAKACCFQTTA